MVYDGKKALTQEPVILVWSLLRRAPVLRCQALVPTKPQKENGVPSRSVNFCQRGDEKEGRTQRMGE